MNEYAFLFKDQIHPGVLLNAQGPLSGTIITGVTYKAGVYYLIISARNENVIKSFIDTCASDGLKFSWIDIDNPFDGCYMFDKNSKLISDKQPG